MDHARTVVLEDESPIASMKSNVELGIVSVGDELGWIHLLNAEKAAARVCVEKEVCLVDHCWISPTQIVYTSGKDIKMFDFEKQIGLQQFIGHEKVIRNLLGN